MAKRTKGEFIDIPVGAWNKAFGEGGRTGKARAPRRSTPAPIQEQLLDALRRSDVTPYQIGKTEGVDKAVLSRFKAGNRPRLTLTQAEKIAKGLGLRLVLVADDSGE